MTPPTDPARRYRCAGCGEEYLAESGSHGRVVVRTRTGWAHDPSCDGRCRSCPVPIPEPYEDLEECGPVLEVSDD
jgi:hypothetical protein